MNYSEYPIFHSPENLVPINIRYDLKDLGLYLGGSHLAEGLIRVNARRVLEVGVGGKYNDLSAIETLASLHNPRIPLPILRDSLWAIDPELSADLKSEFLVHFTTAPVTIQEMGKRIKQGEVAPFDLIFSRGLVSIDGLFLAHVAPEDIHTTAIEIIQAMIGCLNPLNRNALLMITEVMDEYALACSQRDLQGLGLEVVYAKPPEEPDWISEQDPTILRKRIDRIQGRGWFPNHSQEVLFTRVICRRE